jgi:DNA-binding NarL/FixJ family response regulator
MIRVAIVDEHPVARRGFMAMCQAQPDFAVVAAVPDPGSLPDGGVGVVVCDPYPFGAASWLGGLRELAARERVLVVSGSGRAADVLTAVQAGVRGYLTKQAGTRDCVAAVRAVAAGAVCMPAALATRVSSGGDGAAAPARTVLSGREQQALAYIARGFTHQQTATRMGVSKATVDTYIGRIRGKLRIGNKAELALAALRYVEPQYRLPVTQAS